MLCILFAFVYIATIVSSNNSFEETVISENIKTTLKCRNNPGLAVSVVRDGKVLLSRGYGVVDIFEKKAITSSTLFGIASITKSFAATLLVKLLYENTNMTVDSPVRELLGEKFQMPDAFRSIETTFADVMAHRTGIPPNNYIRFDNNLTRETLIERLRLLTSPRQFRVKYYYNNIMYGLVTRLAEIIGGERWENLITKHLFQPLGMYSSTFATIVNFGRDDIAVGYETNNGTYSRVHAEFSRRWSELAGSGSVMSNVEDMAKWMNFHLYDGHNMQGQIVISSNHLEEVHKPRFLIPATDDKMLRIPVFPITSSGEMYAHGFKKGFYRGYEHLSHSGSTQGYRAYLSLLPAQKIGVFIVLTGDDIKHAYRVALVMYLIDHALGLEPWLNITTICSYPEPWTMKANHSSSANFQVNTDYNHDLQQYEGTFYNSAYGYLLVNYNDTVSTFVMMYGWGKWHLLRFALQNEASVEKFYGKAMEATQLNLNPIYFVTKIQNWKIIVGVKIAAFEPEAPPIFDKISTKTNSTTVINCIYVLMIINLMIIFGSHETKVIGTTDIFFCF